MKKQTIILVLLTVSIGVIAVTWAPILFDRPKVQEVNTTIIDDRSNGEVFPPKEGVVKIGYIVASTAYLNTAIPFLEEIVEPDLNEYLSSQGQNFTVEFVIESADGQAEIHLQKAQELKANGIDLFIGGGWSSQAQAALSYVNENDMLMVSSSATSPLLSIPDDRLFRTCTPSTKDALALAEIMDSLSITHVIVCQDEGSLGDPFYNLFIIDWEARGHSIDERIMYPRNTVNFSSYLSVMQDRIIELNNSGIMHENIGILCLETEIITAAQDYAETTKVLWFSPREIFLYREQFADSLGAPNMVMFPQEILWSENTPKGEASDKIQNINERYRNLTGQPSSIFTLYSYDAAWLLTLSVLEAESTNASIVVECLPEVASNYVGLSGLCTLDANGDRVIGDYDICGFTVDPRNSIKYGKYDSLSKEMIWFEDIRNLQEREDRSDALAASVPKKLAESNTQFAFDLFNELVEEDKGKNIFISPLSISTALSMVYNGAEGTTEDAIGRTLQMKISSTDEMNQAYMDLFTSLETADPKVNINIANSVWMEDSFDPIVNPEFKSDIETYFDGELFTRNFGDSRGTISDINNWVSQKTNGLIDKMIEEVASTDVMYLLNAIYFKGEWLDTFDVADTQPRKFYLSGGGVVEPDTMHGTGEYHQYGNNAFTAIRVPYGRDKIAMYIFLPAQGRTVDGFISSLTQEKFDEYIDQMDLWGKIEVRIPKFKLEYGSKRLNDILVDLGMGVAFDSSQADFGGIAPGPLWISYVDHKAVIEVNEEGTEAAATTLVTVGRSGIHHTSFYVDRPFFFVIHDDRTDTILFMGKIMNPLQETSP